VYLYRAVDARGQTVDFRLSRKRDVAAAKAFFRKAVKTQGRVPGTITLILWVCQGRLSYLTRKEPVCRITLWPRSSTSRLVTGSFPPGSQRSDGIVSLAMAMSSNVSGRSARTAFPRRVDTNATHPWY
jgi:hypothetical protein